jgi:hypothetical protein
MASSEEKEIVLIGPNEDYLAQSDIWVNAEWTKTVEAGTPGAIHFVRAGQAIAHESAIQLGLIKARPASAATKSGSSASSDHK